MPIKNTLFIGKVLHHFPVLGSTNDQAVEYLLSERPPEGTVIVADHQTAGRGQMGHSWDTIAGQNLTLSIILYPKFLQARHQFDLNQAIALGVRDTIANFTDKSVKVKWPNDILIEKRKICGILIQNTLMSRHIPSSIIGIGLNVNQKKFASSLVHASSLALEEGKNFDLEELRQYLFHCLESWYLQLRQGRIQHIREKYIQHLFQVGERQLYVYPNGQTFYGQIIGVDISGKLQMKTTNGIELFALKEVQYRL